MSTLRLSVVFGTIIALLVLAYYTVRELLAAWRELTTLSHLPITAQSEQSMYMLLVHTIAFSIVVVLLLVVVIAVLHFARRLP